MASTHRDGGIASRASRLIRDAGLAAKHMWGDKCFTQAAAISYYMVFSIFPVLLLLIGVAGFFLEPEETQQRILEWISQYFPTGTRRVFRENLTAIVKARESLSLLSLAGLVWSATLMFDAINEAVNTAWGTQHKIRFLSAKLKSIALIAILMLLVLLSALLTTQVRLILHFQAFLTRFQWGDWIWQMGSGALSLLGWIVPLAITVGAFAIAYRFLPRAPVRLRDIWPAAVLASLMWELSKWGFVWYLTDYANYGRIYGSISAFLVLLLWSYLSSLILIWGAEFAAVGSGKGRKTSK